MKKRVLGILCVWWGLSPLGAMAAPADSVKVERLLQEAASLPSDSCRTLFYAQCLLGIPYAAHTLDERMDEPLVVHLDRADCTTFVETVLALAWSEKQGKATYADFRQALTYIRYRDGMRDGYLSRLHYFSDWIADNTRKRVVKERTQESKDALPQRLRLHFMSAHADSYPPLKAHPEWVNRVVEMERPWQDREVYYLPKDRLHASPSALPIANGDVLALTTTIAGLDVVHVGFACWVGQELHMLHASSVQKKVILDPQPLYDYLRTKKTYTGVRVLAFP